MCSYHHHHHPTSFPSFGRQNSPKNNIKNFLWYNQSVNHWEGGNYNLVKSENWRISFSVQCCRRCRGPSLLFLQRLFWPPRLTTTTLLTLLRGLIRPRRRHRPRHSCRHKSMMMSPVSRKKAAEKTTVSPPFPWPAGIFLGNRSLLSSGSTLRSSCPHFLFFFSFFFAEWAPKWSLEEEKRRRWMGEGEEPTSLPLHSPLL